MSFLRFFLENGAGEGSGRFCKTFYTHLELCRFLLYNGNIKMYLEESMEHKQNLHMHTTYADGRDTPEELILAAL